MNRSPPKDDESFSPAVCLLHRSAVSVCFLLQPPVATLTERMLPPEWTQSFQMKAQDLKHGDTWKLEYDENIEPKNPNMNWKEYIRNTSARFKCSVCHRQWPSNRVMVIFHMCLRNRQGTVKVRLLRQNCKMCSDAPMENPSVDSDNINILMEKLVEKIKQKCYHENLEEVNRQFKSLEVKNPHEPKHCEGCIKGVCTNNQ